MFLGAGIFTEYSASAGESQGRPGVLNGLRSGSGGQAARVVPSSAQRRGRQLRSLHGKLPGRAAPEGCAPAWPAHIRMPLARILTCPAGRVQVDWPRSSTLQPAQAEAGTMGAARCAPGYAVAAACLLPALAAASALLPRRGRHQQAPPHPRRGGRAGHRLRRDRRLLHPQAPRGAGDEPVPGRPRLPRGPGRLSAEQFYTRLLDAVRDGLRARRPTASAASPRDLAEPEVLPADPELRARWRDVCTRAAEALGRAQPDQDQMARDLDVARDLLMALGAVWAPTTTTRSGERGAGRLLSCVCLRPRSLLRLRRAPGDCLLDRGRQLLGTVGPPDGHVEHGQARRVARLVHEFIAAPPGQSACDWSHPARWPGPASWSGRRRAGSPRAWRDLVEGALPLAPLAVTDSTSASRTLGHMVRSAPTAVLSTW